MYKFSTVKNIVFGAGALEKLGAIVPPEVRVLVISGQSARRNGVIDRLQALLAPRAVKVYDRVQPEPTIQQVDEVRSLARTWGAEAIVAVGGGSVLDVGKVTAAAAGTDLPTAEFFYNRAVLPAAGCFMAALPTTAGTGAEVTPNGVFTDCASNIKQSIRGGSILPTAALIDPLLTVDCPPAVTAASGLDALTQGIESYIARNSNHLTRALAMQGVKLIDRSIEKACNNGQDITARSDMSEGTVLGALAFAVSGLGAVHGLAHPLGARLHLPHGLICGVLLPVILRWNSVCCQARLDELAAFLGYERGDKLIERVEQLLEKFQIQRRLSAYGLQTSDFDYVIKNSRSGSMRANCRDLSDADLLQILQEMY